MQLYPGFFNLNPFERNIPFQDVAKAGLKFGDEGNYFSPDTFLITLMICW
jgi:hypothetical protein